VDNNQGIDDPELVVDVDGGAEASNKRVCVCMYEYNARLQRYMCGLRLQSKWLFVPS
jgi:hypothetical protein